MKFKNGIFILVGTALLAAHAYLGMTAIRVFSPTYDEPVHLTAGIAALKENNYEFLGRGHPPLGEMWAAFPLLFSPVRIPVQDPAWITHTWTAISDYRFADKFLYKNNLSPDQIMGRARTMQLGLSILLIALIGATAYLLAGPWAMISALGLSVFSSTFLAHGSLVTTDLSFTAFFFLFFASFKFHAKKWGAPLTGILLGLCATSKYSVMMVGPVLLALVGWAFIFNKEELKKIKWNRVVVALGCSILTILTVYRFVYIGSFINGLKHFYDLSQSGRSSFFMGEYGTNGRLAYFPVAFFTKTEIPILIAFALGLFLLVRRKINLPSYLWIPAVVYFGVACFSKVQIGHRHIFPIYPFLILFCAVAISVLPPLVKKLSVPILLIWMGFLATSIQPNFLPYFNEFIGGSKNGFKYFTDSNNDWGQGLKQLAQSLDPEDLKKGIYLSYFGVGDPHAYGIKYIDLCSDFISGHQDDSKDPDIHPEKIAISITNYQDTYFYDKTLFDWIKPYPVWKDIGHSIFVYDFSGQPDFLKKVKAMSEEYARSQK